VSWVQLPAPLSRSRALCSAVGAPGCGPQSSAGLRRGQVCIRAPPAASWGAHRRENVLLALVAGHLHSRTTSVTSRAHWILLLEIGSFTFLSCFVVSHLVSFAFAVSLLLTSQSARGQCPIRAACSRVVGAGVRSQCGGPAALPRGAHAPQNPIPPTGPEWRRGPSGKGAVLSPASSGAGWPQVSTRKVRPTEPSGVVLAFVLATVRGMLMAAYSPSAVRGSLLPEPDSCQQDLA